MVNYFDNIAEKTRQNFLLGYFRVVEILLPFIIFFYFISYIIKICEIVFQGD